jgi:hypothetical protein
VKFRPKLDPAWRSFSGVWLILAFVVCIFCLIPRHKYLAALWGATLLIALSASVWAYLSTYWEVTPDCLIVRRLWRKKEIPWPEVREIRWLDRTSGALSVDIGHRVEDYDWFEPEPSDMDGFIAALREHAQQATFQL